MRFALVVLVTLGVACGSPSNPDGGSTGGGRGGGAAGGGTGGGSAGGSAGGGSAGGSAGGGSAGGSAGGGSAGGSAGGGSAGGSAGGGSGGGSAQPMISSVMPAQVVRGYQSLTLTGTGLAGATVTIGNVTQPVTSSTATQVVVMPVAAATPLGLQPLVATTTGGGASPGADVTVLDQLRTLHAEATSATQLVVTFSRPVDSTSVSAARFTIDGLTVVAATAATNRVTLTTSAQVAGAVYAVTADSMLRDMLGSGAGPDVVPFTGFSPLPTELVVVRVGDGATALSASATPVVLERRAIVDGGVIGELALPVEASGAHFPFTLLGNAIAEGALSRSADGGQLAMLGYQSVPGTLTVNGIPRVVAVVDRPDFFGGGTIDTSTTIATVYANTAPRGAVVDGTNIWLAGGTSGTYLTTLGATSVPVSIAAMPPSLRGIGIFDGQLYVATGTAPTGLYQVGTGLPVTTASSTLVAATASPYGFAVFDLNPNEPGPDTLYLADDFTAQGIKRFVRTGGVWGTTPQAVLGPPVRQLACFQDGADVVCVAASSTVLYRVRDVAASLPSSQTALSVIGNAPANFAFRGVSLLPGR